MAASALTTLAIGSKLQRAGAWGALLIAFAIALPAASEARILGLHHTQAQSEGGVRNDCTIRPLGRVWIRGVRLCKGQIAASTLPAQRVSSRGKMALALAAQLYCRKLPINLSAFTRKTAAGMVTSLPLQRLIGSSDEKAIVWPGGRLAIPLDTGMVELFTFAPLPDG